MSPALALVLALAAAPAAARAQDELPEAALPPVRDADSVLRRRPSEWPLADPRRWQGWIPEAAPPDEIAPLLQEIGRTYAVGDLPGALDAIFGLLEREPGYPPALHQAGVIYFRLRRYGDAALAFERYLQVQPARVRDTRALAHCYYTLGQFEQAKEHYERVLAEEPESVEALRGYALAHMRLGEAGRALELLAEVVELEPEHANARAWIAQILFDEERVEEALEAAQRARDLDPYEPRPWYLLAQILFDLGRDEEGEAAHARFQLLARVDQEARALEARLLYDPRRPELLERLVVLQRQAGNLSEVRRALLRWLMVQPDDIALRIHVLDVLSDMGDVQGSSDAAEALAQVGANDALAWKRLAQHYARTRERVKQVEAERRCAELVARGDR